jgi:hypothetical protein
MTNKSVILVIPGLLSAFLEGVADDFNGLKTILSRATLQRHPSGFENALKRLFDGFGKGAFNEGPFGAYAAGWVKDPLQETWCRINFLDCQIDHQTAHASGGVKPPLNKVETQALAATFTPFFKEVGLDLYISEQSEWFLRVSDHVDVVTNGMASIIGKSIINLLPSGPDQVFWRRLFTECQMLLSTHPVNIQRRERAEPEVLCFWFEGLGRIQAELTSDFHQIYTNDSAIQGVAKWAGGRGASLSEGEHSSVLNNLPVAIIDRSFLALSRDEYINKLMTWERQWFKPLYDASVTGKIASLIIDDCSGRQFIFKPQNQYYFWRRIKPLSAFTVE